MKRPAKKVSTEICNTCGRSVARGSGWFANRVPDLNTVEDRKAARRLYPRGDWVCAECEDSSPLYDAEHSRHTAALRRLWKEIDNLYPRQARQRG